MNSLFDFHVGYFEELHPEPSINFQINRWINYLGPGVLEDIRPIIPKLIDINSYRSEFLKLAEQALIKGDKLRAAYYFRSAEFFMNQIDPAKMTSRQHFQKLLREFYKIKKNEYYEIPYSDHQGNGLLPVYFFSHDHPKDTVLIHGGFDSCIEEFFPIIFHLRDQGFSVVCFEGPGQGGALYDSKLFLTHVWHKPVRTILNYFNLDDVTLVGISMGGCLALRAAAFEKRIKRVIAYDVFYDWMDTTLCKLNPFGGLLKVLLDLRSEKAFNLILSEIMKQSHLFDWAMHQAMLVLGVSSSFEVFEKSRYYKTRDIASQVDQDVLLLAGTEDHIIPLKHYYKQIDDLKNARSKTTRLFTREECGQNHCQIGNLKLAIDFMISWIENKKLDNRIQIN